MVCLFGFYIFFVDKLARTDAACYFLTSLVSYNGLGYCYFHFINLGETARRIRILRELYDNKSGLTEEGILKNYNSIHIVEKRLERLLKNKQIILKDNKYFVSNPAMLFMSNLIVFLKLLAFGKRSEHDID